MTPTEAIARAMRAPDAEKAIKVLRWHNYILVPTVAGSEACEAIAQWMIERGYATGHGDTVNDLLDELTSQVRAAECASFNES